MSGSDDLTFTVQTAGGPVQARISAEVLRSLAGRSHVTAGELLDIYRSDLEAAVEAKADRGSRPFVRLERSDLR